MNTRIISTLSLAAAMSLVAIVPAFAQVDDTAAALNASASVTGSMTGSMPGMSMSAGAKASGGGRMSSTTRAQNMQQRMQNMQSHGGQAITARITSLNNLLTRLRSMKNLSVSEKASFQTTIQGAITDMTSLQAKIQADTSTTSLMADVKSIAPDYRIYRLIDPQVSILAAADRVGTIVTSLQTVSGKLQARLAAAASLSTSATLQADLTDMNAQLAEASVQSQAATTEVVGLVPDQGVQTVMDSNTAALKDARTKIQAATKDIQAAYKDAQAIVQGVKGAGTVSASTSASGSVSATTSVSAQ